MPTVRFEIKKFGRARGAQDSQVPVISGFGATGVFTPTGASQKAFGPVPRECDVVIKSIGGAIYAVSGPNDPSPPVAAAAPAPGEYIPDGGYATFSLKAGDAISVITANLT